MTRLLLPALALLLPLAAALIVVAQGVGAARDGWIVRYGSANAVSGVGRVYRIFAHDIDHDVRVRLFAELSLDGTRPPHVSPDGRSVLFYNRGSGGYALYDAASGRVFADWPVQATAPVWSPDSRALVYSDGGIVVRWLDDLATPQRLTVAAPDAPHADPVWSPDGTRIAYRQRVAGSGGLYQLMLVTLDGAATPLLDPIANLHRIRWIDGGARLSFATETVDSIYTVAADGTDLRTFIPPAEGFSYPQWSPDGGGLVYHTYAENPFVRDQIVWWQPAAGDRSLVVAGDAQDDTPATWSPRGDGLVYIETSYRQVYVVDLDGERRRLTDDTRQYELLP